MSQGLGMLLYFPWQMENMTTMATAGLSDTDEVDFAIPDDLRISMSVLAEIVSGKGQEEVENGMSCSSEHEQLLDSNQHETYDLFPEISDEPVLEKEDYCPANSKLRIAVAEAECEHLRDSLSRAELERDTLRDIVEKYKSMSVRDYDEFSNGTKTDMDVVATRLNQVLEAVQNISLPPASLSRGSSPCGNVEEPGGPPAPPGSELGDDGIPELCRNGSETMSVAASASIVENLQAAHQAEAQAKQQLEKEKNKWWELKHQSSRERSELEAKVAILEARVEQCHEQIITNETKHAMAMQASEEKLLKVHDENNSEKQELMRQLGEFQASIKHKESEFESMKLECAKYSAQLESLMATNAKIVDDNSTLKRQVEQQMEEKQAQCNETKKLEKQVSEMHRELVEVKANQNGKENEVERLNCQLGTVLEQLNASEQVIDKLREDVASGEDRQTQLRHEYAAAAAEAKEEMRKSMEKRIAAMQECEASLQQAVEDANRRKEEECSILRVQVSELNEKLQTGNAKLEESEAQLDSIKEKYESDISNLSKQNETLKEQVEIAKESKKASEEQVEALQLELADMKLELANRKSTELDLLEQVAILGGSSKASTKKRHGNSSPAFTSPRAKSRSESKSNGLVVPPAPNLDAAPLKTKFGNSSAVAHAQVRLTSSQGIASMSDEQPRKETPVKKEKGWFSSFTS